MTLEERMRALVASWRKDANRLAFSNRITAATQYRNFADMLEREIDSTP